jgi:phosphoserine phosphatase RsbU/P
MRDVVGPEPTAQQYDLLDAVLAAAPMGLAVVRAPEFVFELVNPAYEALACRARPGRSVAAAWPGSAAENVALLERVVETDAPVSSDDVRSDVERAPGMPQERYFSFAYHPLGGGVRGHRLVLATVIETTAQVQARRRAEEAEARAWNVAHVEEQLMAIVGHDLRTPLSAISLTTEVLFRRGGLSPEDGRTLSRIASSASRMSAIVRDLLDLSRARQGMGIRVEKARVDLGEISRRALQEFGGVEDRQPVALAIEGDVTLQADAARLGQVIANLVGNAAQHGASSPIEVRVTGRSQDVTLAVHNLGPPIPPAALPHVFEAFRRGPAGGERSGSVGLGLFIVQHIVASHGGTVSVASEAERGTTFTVRLPRR